MKTLVTRMILYGLLVANLAACRVQVTDEGTDIHDIQRCTHESPLLGREVKEVQGIVTKKMDTGFVMQSATTDDQLCSSEGIFVHTLQYSNVSSGDLVAVNGNVAEFTPGNADQMNLSQTEITDASVHVISSGNALPGATLLGRNGYPFPRNIIEDDEMSVFDPQSDGLDYFESLEWMRVELPSMIVVGPRNVYNEIVVTEEINSGTSPQRSSFALVASASNLHPERLMIQLPEDWTRKVNTGDRLDAGVVGVLVYTHGNYKVEPVNQTDFEKFTDPQNSKDDQYSSELRIATYNINNFSQYSSDSKIRLLSKQIARDLRSPDLLILQEVQDDSGTADDGTVSASENLNLLVESIAAAGGGNYEYYDFEVANNSSGGIRGGNIRTAFLLRKDSNLRIQGVIGNEGRDARISATSGGKLILNPNPGMIGTNELGFANSRKPIIGLFEYKGQEIVVIGVHLVSKGLNSPLYGSEQPISQPELEKRIAEATFVSDWVESIKRISPGAIIVVAGDMNDDEDSQVVRTILGKNMVDTAETVDAGERYSLIHDGLATLFDHILVSNDTVDYSLRILHLNSIFDESTQVSDHDPLLLTLRFP